MARKDEQRVLTSHLSLKAVEPSTVVVSGVFLLARSRSHDHHPKSAELKTKADDAVLKRPRQRKLVTQ